MRRQNNIESDVAVESDVRSRSACRWCDRRSSASADASRVPASPAVAGRRRSSSTSNVTIAPGDHLLRSADLEHPAFIIRGSNITVDFHRRDAARRDAAADPDSFTGLAVLVDGGRERHDQEPDRARLQGRRARAAERRGSTSPARTSATTGRRGSTAWSSTRACSTGCRITTTRRTSGWTRARGSTSPTPTAPRSITPRSSRGRTA